MAIVQVKDAEGSVLDWMVGVAQSIPNLHVVDGSSRGREFY